ncbi:MAG TPA: hypothetical protein VN756_09265 [Solirubrobacterales bacterium]|nr:hypothetical protein [Solirubrobacterales bacterium]
MLVTSVGGTTGSRAAAVALACAASEPDRPALLIDLDQGRVPRSSLIATAAARKLEERLVVHLPDAGVASRGTLCQLKLSADPSGLDGVAAVLPAVRGSVAVIHLPPRLLQSILDDSRIRPTSALLRADLAQDRALTALAVRDLIDRGLRVAVLKCPIGWLAARSSLFGVMPGGNGGLPARMAGRLLALENGVAALT